MRSSGKDAEFKKTGSPFLESFPKKTRKTHHNKQPSVLRLIQLLGAQLDHGADAADAEAQGAVLNSISACEK